MGAVVEGEIGCLRLRAELSSTRLAVSVVGEAGRPVSTHGRLVVGLLGVC